jgi:hypothetical protein
MTRRRILLLGVIALGLVLGACDVVDAPPNPDEPSLVIDPTTTTTAAAPATTLPCESAPPTESSLELSGDVVDQSIELARRWSGCVSSAVLARPGKLDEAVAVAAAQSAPLIAWDPIRGDEITAVLQELGVSEIVTTSATIAPALDVPIRLAEPSAPPNPSGGPLWLVPESRLDPSLLRHLATLNGATAIVGVPIGELTDDQRALIAGADEVVWTPEPTATERWQLAQVLGGISTVNGTSDLLENTRFVAFYGNPTTGALGVLGEQGPEATLERMAPIVADYGADGALAVPTFEIIATVADAPPGDDGNYSAEMGPELIRPWVDVATENDAYVVLDLQPGRTDFLTQAQLYEEFLRLPNVGLALDPEWRLGPNERHLRQIGSVTAEEINLTSEWLAEIVREELLPQKLLIVHQFRFDMIEGREQIELRPELATVIQMDGQGPLPTKYETFGALTGAPDADRFAWGWKNFYDEDSPMATAAQVLDLDPLPVFISFQ